MTTSVNGELIELEDTQAFIIHQFISSTKFLVSLQTNPALLFYYDMQKSVLRTISPLIFINVIFFFFFFWFNESYCFFFSLCFKWFWKIIRFKQLLFGCYLQINEVFKLVQIKKIFFQVNEKSGTSDGKPFRQQIASFQLNESQQQPTSFYGRIPYPANLEHDFEVLRVNRIGKNGVLKLVDPRYVWNSNTDQVNNFLKNDDKYCMLVASRKWIVKSVILNEYIMKNQKKLKYNHKEEFHKAWEDCLKYGSIFSIREIHLGTFRAQLTGNKCYCCIGAKTNFLCA